MSSQLEDTSSTAPCTRVGVGVGVGVRVYIGVRVRVRLRVGWTVAMVEEVKARWPQKREHARLLARPVPQVSESAGVKACGRGLRFHFHLK